MAVNPAGTAGSQGTSYSGGGAASVQRFFNENGIPGSRFMMGLPIQLSTVTNGDIATEFSLPFAVRIEKTFFIVTTAVTTGSKAATLNMEVGTTNMTGGTIALSGLYALGAVINNAAAPSAGNTAAAGDLLSVEASAVTAFSEGAGTFYVVMTDTFGG